MLGVVWAVEHCHLYLYGSEFTIITDHKPLLGIFNSHKPTSARIDRWKLRLMSYNCQLTTDPEKMPRNRLTLSRHPRITGRKDCNIAEDYLKYICNRAKSDDTARSQVRDREGHFTPGVYQGHRKRLVVRPQSTGK